MSEQDDRFKKDAELERGELTSSSGPAEQDSGAASLVAEDAAHATTVAAESVESPDDVADQGVAAGEVRVVDPPSKQGSSAYILLALLLLVALLGGGYYLVNGGLSGELQRAESVQSATAKRFPIDRQVEEEVVDQKQVAVVEAVTAAVPEKPVAAIKKAVAEPVKKSVPAVQVERKKVAAVVAPYRVLVGPYLTKKGAEKAAEKLRELGFSTEMTRGRGQVSLTRLLEGVYLKDNARERLAKVKQSVGDAFMLPTGDKWAIYVGSFTDADRAARYVEQLSKKGLNVTPVASDVEMDGRMIIAARGDQQTAQKASARISAAGLSARVLQQ